jgi:Xaa-Pro aminopeptidase
MFAQKVYIERRNILKSKIKEGLILLFGNDHSPMNYADNAYPFRQDSTFLYYFGIQRAGLIVIIDVDSDKEIIFGDEYSVEDWVWMGPQPTIEDQAEDCGVSRVWPTHKIGSYINQAKVKGQLIHFLPLYRAENRIKLQELIGVAPHEVAIKFSVTLVQAVIAQREFKSEEEIQEINRAVDVSVDMHLAAMKFARPGMTEAQVTAEVHKVAISADGNLSFSIIATINGQTLHNHYHGNTLKEGDLLLIDAGFENKMCYAGDLSSTIPVSRKFTSAQKELYQITLDAHQAAIDALGLGVPFKSAHMAACIAIFDGLKSMGFTKGNTMNAVEQGAHALFFPCGTGQMMGLDVHDMEDLGEVWVGYDGEPKSDQFGLKSLRLAKPLQVGHVFTIEPGIYFIPELIDLRRSENKCSEFINWDKLDHYRTFGGIRNEENFVMTQHGAQLLGKSKPKTIAEIEAIRSY